MEENALYGIQLLLALYALTLSYISGVDFGGRQGGKQGHTNPADHLLITCKQLGFDSSPCLVQMFSELYHWQVPYIILSTTSMGDVCWLASGHRVGCVLCGKYAAEHHDYDQRRPCSLFMVDYTFLSGPSQPLQFVLILSPVKHWLISRDSSSCYISQAYVLF